MRLLLASAGMLDKEEGVTCVNACVHVRGGEGKEVGLVPYLLSSTILVWHHPVDTGVPPACIVPGGEHPEVILSGQTHVVRLHRNTPKIKTYM